MRFNIRQKLLFGFAIVLAAMLGVGGFAYLQISQLEETLRLTQGKEALLGRAQSALWELRLGFAQFVVLTGQDERQKITDAEPRLYKVLEENLAAYGASPGLTEDEIAGHKDTLESWNAYKEMRPQWFTYMADNQEEEARDWQSKYTTPLGAATVKAFSQLIETTHKADAQRRERQVAAAQQAQQLMIGLGALAVLLALTVALLVLRSMLAPIRKLQAALDQLTAGDYSARTGLSGHDELGRLGQRLDQLLDERLETLTQQARESETISNSVVEIMQAMSLVAMNKDLSIKVPVTPDVTGTISDAMNMLTAETAKVLSKVVDVSGDVSSASLQMQQSSDSALSTAAQSQNEVEAAAQELLHAAETLTGLAQSAQRANESAEQAVRTTRQALATVDRTVSGINESRDQIRETEKRIKRLGERSQEIFQVVGLINSIAERTGILALNASMQAAAAGDAGRGFAIVAEEVKRLSENAREATREISTLVSSIQSETSETVLAMNSTIARVVDVSRLADQAGAEMKGTQEATDELATNVRHIASTSVEQARAGQTLQARAQAIQQASRDTSRQLTLQNEVTHKLVASAQTLQAEVRVFKLPRSRQD